MFHDMLSTLSCLTIWRFMENPLLKLKDEVMQHLVNEVQLQFMLYIIHSKDLQKIIFISPFFKDQKQNYSHTANMFFVQLSWKINSIQILIQGKKPPNNALFFKSGEESKCLCFDVFFYMTNLENIKSLMIVEVLLITHYSERCVNHFSEGFDGFLIAHKTKVMIHRFTDWDPMGFYTSYCILLMKAILMLSLRKKSILSNIPMHLLWLLIGKQQVIYSFYQVCNKYLFYSYMF